MEFIKQEDLNEMMFWHFRRNWRTAQEAAEHYQCTPQFISNVQNGRALPNEKMRRELGIRLVQGFVYEGGYDV